MVVRVNRGILIFMVSFVLMGLFLGLNSLI